MSGAGSDSEVCDDDELDEHMMQMGMDIVEIDLETEDDDVAVVAVSGGKNNNADKPQKPAAPDESSDIVAISERLYCICRLPWDTENSENQSFMIQCDGCREWFHGSCVGIPEQSSLDIYKYHCSVCEKEPSVGPTLYKDASHKKIKAGSDVFLARLMEKEFPSGDEVIVKLRGPALNLPRVVVKGFSKPILVEELSGLHLKVPDETFTVRDVEKYVGSDRVVDVIDVLKQMDTKMTMKEFVDYFTDPARTKLYNLISLEFSNTELGKLVLAPDISRKLDWVQMAWPELDSSNYEKNGGPPEVSKYCLISAKNSYTDFHIDFGGTSVWYHILWGSKVFYLVEPTKTNLVLYERWMCSVNQYETFFGDIVDFCYRVVLKKGQTLFIPTGWIHGVLTPEDSLVFGGNFLHSLNMDLQLKIYEIEKSIKVPGKYLFPHFEATHWYAGQKVIDDFQSLTAIGPLPPHLLNGVKALVRAFRSWSGEKTTGREIIPKSVKPQRLIKLLTKIIRISDKKYQIPKETKQVGVRGWKKKVVAGTSGDTDSLYSISNPSSPIPLDDNSVHTFHQLARFLDAAHSPPSKGNSGRIVPIKLTLKRKSSVGGLSSPRNTNQVIELIDLSEEEPGTPPANDTEKLRTSVEPSSDDNSQKPATSQRIPSLKMRLSLSESKAELLPDEKSLSSSNGAETASQDDSDSDGELQIVETNVADKASVSGSCQTKEKTKKKSHHRHRHSHSHHSKSKKHGKCKGRHHKSKSRTDRDNGLALDNVLAGELNTMEKLFTDAKYKERLAETVQSSDSMKAAMAEIIENESLPLKKRLGRGKKRKEAADPWAEENIEQVHQDADFIYLPLAGESSDEDVSSRKKASLSKRKKRKADKAEDYNPNVKMGQISKRDGVPSRVNAKVKAVEKGLENASATLEKEQKQKALAQQIEDLKTKVKSVKSLKKTSKPKSNGSVGHSSGVVVVRPVPSVAMASTLKELSTPIEAAPIAGTSTSRISATVPSKRKPKKGYATPKQRLGKIIKLSKFKFT